MKIKTENLGTYSLLASIVLMIIGVIGKNDTCLLLGGSIFIFLIGCISKMINEGIKDYHTESEARAYAIKLQADIKADLLAKAYEDNNIKDEDISFLVRSLASDVKLNTTQITQAPIIQTPIKDVYDKPVIEVKDIEKEDLSDTEPEENNLVVPFEIVSGKFTFKYNGKDMAFGANDVTKGEYPHEEFSDSIGYYKNADAVFYIYPKEKQIAIVNI